MTSYSAPERMVAWWAERRQASNTFPFPVSYHPRSDEHSKILCNYILEDLIEACEPLARQARAGGVCYDVNHVVYGSDGRQKVLDLVIGQPALPVGGEGIRRGKVTTPGIRIAIEAKACMTKHRSAMPRLRDELCGSMTSACESASNAIVGGIVVVNMASKFLSPTNQLDPLPPDPSLLTFRQHRQPEDATFVVQSLDRLPFRRNAMEKGFDSLGVIVVEHDNAIPTPIVHLVTTPPAPPPESPRNYRSFIIDMANKYRLRYGA